MRRSVLVACLFVLAVCTNCTARGGRPSCRSDLLAPTAAHDIDHHEAVTLRSCVQRANTASDGFRFEYHWDAEHEEFDREGRAARTFHVIVREEGAIRAEWWAHYLEPFVLAGTRVVRASYDFAGPTRLYVHDLEKPEQGWTIDVPFTPIDVTTGERSGMRGYTSRNLVFLDRVRDDLVRVRTGPYRVAEHLLDLRARRIVAAERGRPQPP